MRTILPHIQMLSLGAVLFGGALAVGLATEGARLHEADWPVNEQRELLAVVLEDGETIAGATTEPDGDNTLIRLFTCTIRGDTHEMRTLKIPSDWGSLRADVTDGEITVGWLDFKGALWWLSKTGSGLEAKKVLDPAGGPSGDTVGWYLVSIEGKRRLFTYRYEAVANPKNIWEVHRSVDWLYSYEMDGAEPKFRAKVRLQEHPFIESDSGSLWCGSSGSKILLWQTFKVSHYRPIDALGLPAEAAEWIWVPDPPVVLRVAEWSDSGQLKWQRRYIAAEALRLDLDPADASGVLVQEPKNGPMGPAICCMVEARNGMIIPLRGVRGLRHVLRTNAEKRKWALASIIYPVPDIEQMTVSSPTSIEVRTYDVDFNELSLDRFSASGVEDFGLAGRGEDLYLVALEKHGVAVHKVPQP